MRDFKFLMRGDLREGFPKGIEEEMWIVPKPARALRLVNNYPVRCAFESCNHRAMRREDDDADVMCRAGRRCGPMPPPCLDAVQFFDKFPVVVLVAGVWASKACRIDPRRPPQGVHTKSGIVGKYQAVNAGAVIMCLLAGVGLESLPVFDARRQLAEAGKCSNVNPERMRRRLEFARFAWVG